MKSVEKLTVFYIICISFTGPILMPQFYTSNANYKFVEGKPLTISCAFYGTWPIFVQIYRNGLSIAQSYKPVNDTSHDKPYPVVRAVYEKESASLADDGAYFCIGRSLAVFSEVENKTMSITVEGEFCCL